MTEDRVWGLILIAAGIAALTFQPFDKLNKFLGAATDEALSMILVLIAAIALVAAIKAPTPTKVLLVAWMVTP